jgi:hypothetical protein
MGDPDPPGLRLYPQLNTAHYSKNLTLVRARQPYAKHHLAPSVLLISSSNEQYTIACPCSFIAGAHGFSGVFVQLVVHGRTSNPDRTFIEMSSIKIGSTKPDTPLAAVSRILRPSGMLHRSEQ